MIQLTVQNISRQFDTEPLFSDVSFTVHAGEKIGLVGPNGTGKSTLIHLLAGLDHPDTGKVELHPACQLALLEQQSKIDLTRTLRDEARTGLAHLYQLQEDAHQLAEQMSQEQNATQQEKLHRQYDDLQHQLEQNNAYNIDHRIDEVLHGLGFSTTEYDRPLSTFSGGQRNRVILARLLLQAPDIMLLDEPTNHLDIESTEWLESYLQRSEQTLFLVSHDRYFLDKVTTRILELNNGSLTDYKGNFSSYWEQRKERQKVLIRTYEKQQAFIQKTETFIRKNKVGQKHIQAADREKKLERLEKVERLDDFHSLVMTFGEPDRTGDWVIDAKNISKGYEYPLFKDFTLRIHRGDRIGILGPNGSGKTTLLKILLNEEQADTGSVRMGTGVKIAYYDQQLQSVDTSSEAVDAITPPDNPLMLAGERRSVLARFGIRGDMAFQKIGSMSGGERSKVALARVAAMNANLLVLDEPTNHLDLWARESLETALRSFAGTLLFVSHDRYFINRLATSVIVLEPDRWFYYEGNYSSYLQFRELQLAELQQDNKTTQQQTSDSSKTSESEKQNTRKRKFPYRKVSEIEAEIAELESRQEELQAAMISPELHRDGEQVVKTMAEFEAAQQKLKELLEHWEEAIELN